MTVLPVDACGRVAAQQLATTQDVATAAAGLVQAWRV